MRSRKASFSGLTIFFLIFLVTGAAGARAQVTPPEEYLGYSLAPTST